MVVRTAFALLCSILSLCAVGQAEPKHVIDPSAPIVRDIRVAVREIFDEPNIGFFYRSVNSLKVSTRTEIILQELLFKEGEAFDQFLLEESERNLRALPFVRKVSITPLVQGNVVDILVSVQDTWTLFPFLNLASGGGTDKTSIGVTEGNVLGYGKRFEVLYADDEGRDKIEGVWEDRRLFGTYQQLTLGHFYRSDGFRSVFSIGRPFRSLVEPYSWSFDTDVFDLVGRLFDAGEERYIYRQERNAVAGGFTIPKGDPEESLRRYTFGYNYTDDDFTNADDDDFEDINLDPDSVSRDPRMLADDRAFSGPTLQYQRIEPDFISINFVDRFERVEDFNLGNNLRVGMQFAFEGLDSTRDTLLLDVSDSDGIRLTPTSFIRGELGSKFRTDEDGINNFILSGKLKYYNVLGPKYLGESYIGKHTFASSLLVNVGEDLDRDFEFLLGAGSGLRGYEDRTFTGDQRVLANVEDRFYFIEDVFRLVSVGGAVFLDGGGTSTKGVGDIVANEFYASVGFGFRFGISRSSGGSVIRVDLAFPLRDGPDGSDRWEPRLLITSGQVFSANLESDIRRRSSAAISSGFLR